MRTIALYSFKFRDPLTKKWIMARYRAEPVVLRMRYAEFELVGPAEYRVIPDDPFTLEASHVISVATAPVSGGI